MLEKLGAMRTAYGEALVEHFLARVPAFSLDVPSELLGRSRPGQPVRPTLLH